MKNTDTNTTAILTATNLTAAALSHVFDNAEKFAEILEDSAFFVTPAEAADEAEAEATAAVIDPPYAS